MGEPEASERLEARSGAQTVERAIDILNLYRSSQSSLTITAVARQTGLNLSTAHRLVRTLVHAGFMEQDPLTEQYRLGPSLAVLGRRALESSGVDLARPVIESIATSTTETVSLGIRRGDDVVIVLQSTSRQALRFEHPSGGSINLHASAMGKVLMAFGDESVKAAVAGLGRLPRFTAATITSHASLLDELHEVRARGFAVNSEERYDGVCGVAAPICDPRGIARYAIGIQGPSVRLTADRMFELGGQLMTAAADAARLVVPTS